jgi:hypothetical protein
VPIPEAGQHGQAFVLGEEALLRDERLPPDLDLQRRVGADVAIQSAPWPQAEQMTASRVCGSYRKTMATVE